MARLAKPKNSSSAKVSSRPVKNQRVSDDEDDTMPKAKASKGTEKATRGSKKAKKDPNAPKRGLSAYMFYANGNRDRVKSTNPDITFGQVGKVLGEEWKALKPDDRKQYEELAAKDKKRYEDQKAAYAAGEDDEEAESD